MLRQYLRRTGFRHQLTVVVSGAILLLALFSSIMNSLESSRRVERYLVEQGEHIADNLARHSRLAVLYQSPENGREGVATTLAFPDVLHVEITDARHRVLVSLDKPGVQRERPDPGRLHQAVERPTLQFETDSEWVFGAPIYSRQPDDISPFDVHDAKPQLLGYARVVLGKDTLHRLILWQLLGNLAITFSFAIVLVGAMRLLTRRLTRPLNELSSLMGRAEAGESGLRARADGPRDIIDMAQAFNKMMGVLEQREAELKASRDEALRTALLKAQFAAMVSHEVRTPLNGVVGMLELLREMRLTRQQQECVDIAWNSSHALIELINDILDFSKMEAGKLQLDETEFDLRALVEEVIELLGKPSQQKGIELGYVFADGVPERIRGDSLRIRQVLTNLVGNAVKFTEHGEVAVRVAAMPVQDDTGHDLRLRFEVVDTGIGMDDAATRHLFENFAQADPSTSRKYGGTGLGLAISKHLVGLMSGEIGVSSSPGAGSTFWFTAACGRSAEQPFPSVEAGWHDLQVLVAEESRVVSDFITANLVAQGMHCRVVARGADALDELGRKLREGAPYDLVVTDIGMANADGEDLVRCLRADPVLAGVRLLVLDRYGATAHGGGIAGNAYVAKPLRLASLLDGVRRALSADPVSMLPLPDALPEPAPADRREYRVLIVEDNRTNQMVAAGMLNIHGCQCDFAGNGREAVEAARRRRYGLILMDCNMPEMDGYEATAHIRNFEESLARRTPIVAMTANTQRGDAEKCLAAGMDDYLAKPITLVELRRKLDRWLARAPAVDADRPQAEPADSALERAVFDKLREILGASLQQALAPFLEDTPTYLAQLAHAVDSGNADLARTMAHSVKGSSGNLGALHLARLAKDAEEFARAQRLEDIRPLLPQLRAAFDAVAAELDEEMQMEERLSVRQGEGSAQVLVVDDDRSTRGALRYTLQRDGFQVEEAADGEQALRMLRRLRPDVILMDAMMPVMDGFTACARLQGIPGAAGIPVLMITALEDRASVERAFAAGASDFIPKPIHFAVLSQRVRRIIDANRAERRVQHLAYNDPLTGLPNRALFFDQLAHRIEQSQASGQAVAVLFLDLDRFKNVNDTLGHAVGDRLLVSVAQRIRSSVRNADCVARLGGDEFTVVLADVASAGAAAAAAQNICRALATAFQIDGHDIFVSTSVGISMYPHDGLDAHTLLKHADTAMYRAKKTKAGFQFFEASMEQSISERVRMENDLRRALERDELEVWYQPQARFEGNHVVGAEALLRWRHPTRGLVSPLEFIPLAEEAGLIEPIGEWVLQSACAQAQRWAADGLPAVRVSVNLSVKQLLKGDIAQAVERALEDSRLPAHLLELEITESTLMEHAEDTLEALERLRRLGVRLAIDDFGTGYSSLAYLKRFPVDVVKIDRSFVRDVARDQDDAAIVRGIIALAHNLRLEVVAEGVETEAQRDFLQQHGCDMLQGYLLGKPTPADQFAAFLAAATAAGNRAPAESAPRTSRR